MTIEEKVELLTGKGLWRSAVNHRLNIPDFVMTDGTYGVRYNVDQIENGQTWDIKEFFDVVNQDVSEVLSNSEYNIESRKSKPATCFPNGSSVGCCWDIDLLSEMGIALGKECQHLGVNLLLGPGINIRRTPLAGRGYEYYSEDPVISGDLAAALINGLQSEGVGACLKHFACNNSEIFRTTMDSVVEERALREIYLHGFERAIKKSKPWTVMSSYNLLNGVQAAENKWLLTDVLRDEWEYDGVVISDWGGIKDRAASLIAGNDLDMPECKHSMNELKQAVESKHVSQEILNKSCERMLTLIFKATEKQRFDVIANFTQHHELARKIASESIVLLKNEENILPIDKKSCNKIAVLGRPAVMPVIQGSGCATTIPTSIDIPLTQIKKSADNNCTIKYADGYKDNTQLDNQMLNEAISISKDADKVIIFASIEVGDDGEGADRKSLNLLPVHEMLIEEIAKINKNIIVVLANSDAVVMPWIDKAKGILETFYAGQGMGKAIADIIFGDVNPSGKLSVTVPVRLEDTPAFLHYPGNNSKHLYSEGIYVGYRYYDKRKIDPLYPFGFGLSYTTFEYSNLNFNRSVLNENEILTVTVDVTNTGDVFGKEIIQLYVKDYESKQARPEQELKAFKKIGLHSKETKTVEFELNKRDFAYYDTGYKRWIVDTGEFEIRIGKSSKDIVLSETVTVITNQKYYPLISLDTELSIILKNPIAIKKLTNLIARKLNISEENAESMIKTHLSESFYGIYKSLSIMLDINTQKEELQDLVDEINKETIEF